MAAVEVFFVLVCVVGIILILTASKSPKKPRMTGSTDQRLCGSCGAAHPLLATYCRRCGKRL